MYIIINFHASCVVLTFISRFRDILFQWYHATLSTTLNNLGCKHVTTIYFRKYHSVMTNDKEMTMLSAEIKEQNCQNIQRLSPILFIFSEGQMHQNQSVCFHFLCCSFVETIYLR